MCISRHHRLTHSSLDTSTHQARWFIQAQFRHFRLLWALKKPKSLFLTHPSGGSSWTTKLQFFTYTLPIFPIALGSKTAQCHPGLPSQTILSCVLQIPNLRVNKHSCAHSFSRKLFPVFSYLKSSCSLRVLFLSIISDFFHTPWILIRFISLCSS